MHLPDLPDWFVSSIYVVVVVLLEIGVVWVLGGFRFLGLRRGTDRSAAEQGPKGQENREGISMIRNEASESTQLTVFQQSEDDRHYYAHLGGKRCSIHIDGLENAIDEAKAWAAYRQLPYTSVIAYSSQGGAAEMPAPQKAA